MSRRSFLTRTRLALLSAGLALVGLELGWRAYLYGFASPKTFGKYARLDDIPPERRRYRPHPYLAYCLNESFRSESGLCRHNSRGFRGEEIAVPKPPGTYRIAVLGGSSTYETSIDDDRLTGCAQLERALRETHGRGQVEVINAGVGGYSSWESMINLELRVLDLEPDLVVVYHGVNDVHARMIPPETFRRDNTGHRKSWTYELHWWDRLLFVRYLGVQWGFSARNTEQDVTKLERPEDLDLQAAIAANTSAHSAENYRNIVALCRDRAVDVLLLSWAWCPSKGDYAADAAYQRGFRDHNRMVEELARARGVPFYDLARDLPSAEELWADGRHNNALGARVKGELVAAAVERLILEPRDAPAKGH